MKIEILNYCVYDNLVNSLTTRIENEIKRLKRTETINSIVVYGLPRGGLPIGVHISHHLKYDLITDLRDAPNHKDSYILLIVDDICDTGITIERVIRECSKNYITATLYVKPQRLKITKHPHIYVKEVEDTTWIVFPWEDPGEAEREYQEHAISSSQILSS